MIEEFSIKKIVVGVVIFLLTVIVLIQGLMLSKNREKRQLQSIQEEENPDLVFARELGMGINIGNSLDSTGLRRWRDDATDLEYETYWHNEPISEEMFVAIKRAGFQSVRIPVTWDEHIDEQGNISEIWMQRVKQVVDWALQNDLYVIINLHHESWLSLKIDEEKQITEMFVKIWSQICNHFKEYNNKLIFEAMNEPRLQDSELEWTAGTEELQQMVNRLNLSFYRTVRGSGGNNKNRYVMIPTYCNSVDIKATQQLLIPGEKVLVSVHGYVPYNFCLADYTAPKWNDEKWGTESADVEIQTTMERLNATFIQKGIPVVITEYAVCNVRKEKERLDWLAYYLSQANQYGISCMWWDDGDTYQLLDRTTCSWCEVGILHKIFENND